MKAMAPTEGRTSRRPSTATVALLTAADHGFELTSGVGLVLQPELGLVPAGALWGVQIPLWIAMATRGNRRWDRLLAVMSGAALAGVVVHFVLWPWRRNKLGLPVLSEAEGLSPSLLPAYSALLHLWGVACVGSIVLDVRPGHRRWSLLGLATLPLLRKSARHHFAWLKEEAQKNPAWWNRGVEDASGCASNTDPTIASIEDESHPPR